MTYDNNQQNAQFNVAPFQRVEINIGNIDRSLGVVIPELEGVGFYVERADFPVFLNLVNQTPLLQSSFVAREGAYTKTPFKGLVITHPFINVPSVLSIIIYKLPCSEYNNQLGQSLTRNGISTRSNLNSAVQQTIGIFLPPGIRALNALSVAIQATTITTIQLSFLGTNNVTVSAPSSLTALGPASVGLVTYNNSNVILWNGTQQSGSAGTGVILCNLPPFIPVPPSAFEAQLVIVGTGLVAPNSFGGYYS